MYHRIKATNTKFTLIIISASLLVISCSNVDTDWHKYQSRKLEIIGEGRDAVKVIADGWKIIGKTNDDNGYEWGWEITISNSRDPEKEAILLENNTKLIGTYQLKKIHYTLHDKDGFELVNDVLHDQYLEYGAIDTFRHTSIISKAKALRAFKSTYRIILRD